MHVLSLETSEIGFDVIEDCYNAEVIRNTVLQEIRNRVQKYSINRIHLLLATPSDFTFFLLERLVLSMSQLYMFITIPKGNTSEALI